MEKYFIILIFFIVNFYSFSQRIVVIDEVNEPIYNVSFYTPDFNKSSFSNFKGEVELSIFKENDSIYIQHPAFQNIILIKKKINEKIVLKSDIIEIDEVIVSVNRWEESLNEVTNKNLIINRNLIEKTTHQTAADLLDKTGEIFVQKSQLGGGSPMMRGFAANRILLSLDGIRLNNIIFRGGNIHNIISIDPNILDGVEVLFGPASVIYGSDAIGGGINFRTKDPTFKFKRLVNGSQNIQYNTSNNSKIYNLNVEIGNNNISNISSLSFSSYDDLISGSNQKRYPDFGLRNEYVKRDNINETDVIIENPNPNKQIESGYSQVNFINKTNIKLNDLNNIIYGIYYSKSSNIPRYDRLIMYDDTFNPKYAEWFYGPNSFLLNKIQLNSFNKKRIYDAFKIIFSNQKIKESRNTRGFNDTNLNHRSEKINVTSINIDFDKNLNKKEFYYGIESIYNYVKSNAKMVNISENSESVIATRYPDKGTDFFSNSIYILFKNSFKKIKYNAGIRANNSYLNAKLSNSFYDFDFNEIEVNNTSVSGNIGLRYDKGVSVLKFQYSNGYRSPNLDDLGKIFDSEPGNVIIPNPSLKAEIANNFEVNYEINTKKLNFQNSLYYIRLNNAITRSSGSYNGQDSIFYDGELSRIQMLKNTGKANVYGFSSKLSYSISKNLLLNKTISYNNSYDISSKKPLRHSPPLFGKFQLNYKLKSFEIIYNLFYNGTKKIKNFSESELNKLYLYTEDGSPSWITHNISIYYNINYLIKTNLSIENISDLHYRTYSSGISAPGRNINFGINIKF